jgi:plasmid stability protein
VAILIVRDLDDALVRALKQSAARHGCSAEAEHRRIPEEALRGPPKRGFAEMLASMPDVGRDQAFARVEDA